MRGGIETFLMVYVMIPSFIGLRGVGDTSTMQNHDIRARFWLVAGYECQIENRVSLSSVRKSDLKCFATGAVLCFPVT
jgi:hypothetical protein